MNNTHRYFVQYMLKNGCVNANNALEYCKKISQEDVTTLTGLKQLLIEINREVSKQFFKVTMARCEVTEQDMVSWVNMKNDKISRLQITFNELELEYFNAILQEIIHSSERKITFIVCINITSTLTGTFSRESGQKVLNKWLKGGYFVHNNDYIHLGIRAILEFTSYLKNNCPQCFCLLCSEIVFTGKICASCDKIYHSYCLNRYCSNEELCPNCKNDWHETESFRCTQNTQEESRMNDESDDDSDPNQPGPSQRRQGRRPARQNQTVQNDSDNEVSTPRPSKRRARC